MVPGSTTMIDFKGLSCLQEGPFWYVAIDHFH